jgi:hypothetical protein
LTIYITQIRELGNAKRLVGEPFFEGFLKFEEGVEWLRKLIVGFEDLKPRFNCQG